MIYNSKPADKVKAKINLIPGIKSNNDNPHRRLDIGR
jgi:hypothetical protein